MACPHRHQALKVLTGELSPAKSNGMLEHFRRCGECREAFDFAAATLSKSRSAAIGAVPAYGAGAEDASSDDAPRRGPGAFPHQVRKNRRTLIVFGVAVVAIAIAGVGRGPAAAPPAEIAAESAWKRLVGDGTPVVQSPAGAFDSRPRVVTALVPLGSGSFRVLVLDDSGRVVFEREAKPGSEGCFLEETSIDAPGGAFRAGRLMTPFPEAEALALVPGRAYGLVVAAGGGHASAASVFQSGRGVELQGAPQEER